MAPDLVSLITQLVPLIDAALAIGKDAELMDILTRIAYNPESIDRNSCTEKERQVLNGLSSASGSKRHNTDVSKSSTSFMTKCANGASTFQYEALSECFSKCARI